MEQRKKEMGKKSRACLPKGINKMKKKTKKKNEMTNYPNYIRNQEIEKTHKRMVNTDIIINDVKKKRKRKMKIVIR